MMMLTPLFRKLALFLPLTDDDKEWLNQLVVSCQEYPDHADIIREDETPTGLFVVIDGHIYRHKTLPDGERQILDFMFPGDMTELHAPLLRKMDHSVSTLAASSVAWIDRDRLVDELRMRPSVTAALRWASLQRIAILRERITALGRRNAYARVSHLLCEIFERLKMAGLADDAHYLLPITQVELADALGMSEVHANRVLRRLQREGLIRIHRRRVAIPDVTALRKAAIFEPDYLHLDGVPTAIRQRLTAA